MQPKWICGFQSKTRALTFKRRKMIALSFLFYLKPKRLISSSKTNKHAFASSSQRNDVLVNTGLTNFESRPGGLPVAVQLHAASLSLLCRLNVSGLGHLPDLQLRRFSPQLSTVCRDSSTVWSPTLYFIFPATSEMSYLKLGLSSPTLNSCLSC